MFRLSLVFVFALVFLVTGCSNGDSKKATLPMITTTRVMDSQIATRLPLRTSDLPSGFAAVDVQLAMAEPMISQCMPELLTASATQLGETFLRNRDVLTSQSYVLHSTHDADTTFSDLTGSVTQDCLLALLQTRFDAQRTAAGLGDATVTPTVSTFETATGLYRLIAVRNAASSTQTVATGDLLVVQSDRTLSAIWLTWFDGSPDVATEKSLVTALRARSAAAFAD